MLQPSQRQIVHQDHKICTANEPCQWAHLLSIALDNLVLTPLDRVEINALLHHFPEWTELSQESHPLTHSLDDIVDLLFRGESSNTKSDTAVCTLVAVA